MQLQERAHQSNPEARLVPAQQIHLTIIHFGIIREVFPQLQAVVPDLDYKRYKQAVATFVDTVEQAMPPQLKATMDRWDLYGFAQHTLVVTLLPNVELEQTHAASLAALRQFFASCGLSEPDSFMASNQNFQFALTLKPHITLLKKAPTVPVEILEPKKLHLQAMPILYD